MSTLKELVKIQSIIDNRAIASDTLETLEHKYYYSKSKGVNIKIGDMHIDHFLRSLNLFDTYLIRNDHKTDQIILKLKQQLKKIKKLTSEKI